MVIDSPLPAPDQTVAEPPAPALVRQLTLGWRRAMGIGWAGVVVGFGCVAFSSRSLGLSTWWLGPESQQRNVFVLILPFVAPVLMCAAAISNARFLPHLGIAAAVVSALIGVGDIDRVPGLAVVELALGGAGLLVSIASFAGMYRRAGQPT